MRLAAQQKMGFYPVKPSTVDLVCQSLTLTNPEKTTILDPCCGMGDALGRFGENLNIPKENRYGIELDENRAEQATPHGNILHASFFGTRIVSVRSLSLAWVNPPYENEIKQHPNDKAKPLEVSFIEHVADYVENDGIIILHCPLDRITSVVEHAFFLVCHDCTLVTLPQNLRPYREALLIGKKRAIVSTYALTRDIRHSSEIPKLTLPEGKRFKVFEQREPTNEEVVASLNKAGFMKVFRQKKVKPVLEPVLPLGPGHLGLVLASGLIDGQFEPQGAEPHVVRGVAYKKNIKVKDEVEVNEDGKRTETVVWRENISLKIRALTADGTITNIE